VKKFRALENADGRRQIWTSLFALARFQEQMPQAIKNVLGSSSGGEVFGVYSELTAVHDCPWKNKLKTVQQQFRYLNCSI
jgi:hypothetical protein